MFIHICFVASQYLLNPVDPRLFGLQGPTVDRAGAVFIVNDADG
jgi:hypothetical protein